MGIDGTASRSGALPLDDVLDLLASREGRDLVEGARRDLERVVDFDGPVIASRSGAEAEDTFEHLAATALTHSFLTRARGPAALPNALVYALSHASDDDGQLTREAVEARLGPKAGRLFAELHARLDGGARDVPTARRRTKYKWLPDEVIERIARSKAAASKKVAERMPLLKELTRAIGGEHQLRGLSMSAVQHLFPTTEGLFDALADNGLDPAQARLHGKNYSTDEDVLYRMRAGGWNVSTFALEALPGAAGGHMNVAGSDLTRLFEGVDPSAEGPRFLLLDEGGKLVTALHEHFPEYVHLCVAVEQTDRGIQLLEAMEAEGTKLGCPVINVARADAKKRHEAPMIGESVVDSTLRALAELHPELEPARAEASVIGYGAVGKATADALRRRGFLVRVFDRDPARMAAAKADGCEPGPREEVLAKAHLLISCTGRTTITPEAYDALPDGAILVNAASGNHELGLDALEGGAGFLTDDPEERVDEEGFRRSTFRGLDLKLGDLAGDEQMFSRVIRSESGAERLALRGGYVVNMVDDIPPELIQLTRGLILAACLQAPQHHGEPGLVELDAKVQDFVVARTARHLRPFGVTLEAPDFRALPPARDRPGGA